MKPRKYRVENRTNKIIFDYEGSRVRVEIFYDPLISDVEAENSAVELICETDYKIKKERVRYEKY